MEDIIVKVDEIRTKMEDNRKQWIRIMQELKRIRKTETERIEELKEQ